MEPLIIKPKKLQLGDKIALAAITRPTDQEILEKSSQYIEKQGFKVVFPKNKAEKYGYLAGSDKTRATAFMELVSDPYIKIIWALGGGYGTTRILDLLDFGMIRSNPKIFIGYSDITALHASLNSISHITSVLGPTIGDVFGLRKKSSGMSIMNNCLDVLLSNTLPILDLSSFTSFKVIKPGQATGRLVGGNLALITSLLATPYALDLRGKILLIEDINEAPYKIDRMLNQLKLAGELSKLKGLILASFNNCDRKDQNSLSLEEVFLDYFKNASYPVISGFPSGHMEYMQTFPLNCEVELDTFSGKFRYLETYFQN